MYKLVTGIDCRTLAQEMFMRFVIDYSYNDECADVGYIVLDTSSGHDVANFVYEEDALEYCEFKNAQEYDNN